MARGRSTRMQKAWDALPGIFLDMTATGTFLASNLTVIVPSTILRIVGRVTIHSTAGGAFGAGDEAFVSFGLGIFSADAVAAGAGSLPEPAGDPSFPWMYTNGASLAIHTAGNAEVALAAIQKFDLDVRSMRRIKPSEALAFVATYSDVVGAPPYSVSYASLRVLIAS